MLHEPMVTPNTIKNTVGNDGERVGIFFRQINHLSFAKMNPRLFNGCLIGSGPQFDSSSKEAYRLSLWEIIDCKTLIPAREYSA